MEQLNPTVAAIVAIIFVPIVISSASGGPVKNGEKKSSGGRSPIKVLILLMLAWYCYTVGDKISKLPKGPSFPGEKYMDLLKTHAESTPLLSEFVQQNTFLVIGGNGYTGSAIVDDLLRRQAKKVVVLARTLPPAVVFPYMRNGQAESYPIPGVSYVPGDIMNVDSLREAMKDHGITVVFHTAAHYGSPRFSVYNDDEWCEKVNEQGMQNVIKIAQEVASVNTVVFTSSTDVTFTTDSKLNANETHPFVSLGSDQVYADGKMELGDPYARSKIKAEKYILSQDGKGGIRTAVIRPNGIIGPGENFISIRAVLPAHLVGFLPVYINLEQQTDYSCVASLSYGHLLAAMKLQSSDADTVGGKPFIITDGEGINTAGLEVFKPAFESIGVDSPAVIPFPSPLMDLFGYGMEILTKFASEKIAGYTITPPINYKEALKVTVTDTHSIERARRDLGFEPIMTTKQCLDAMGEEYGRRFNIKN